MASKTLHIDHNESSYKRLLNTTCRLSPDFVISKQTYVRPHVTSAPSLPVFRSRLKTHLFRRCFPWLHLLFFVVPVKWLDIIGHVNRSFYLLTYLHSNTLGCLPSLTLQTLQWTHNVHSNGPLYSNKTWHTGLHGWLVPSSLCQT